MFIQVIQAPVQDKEGARRLAERWDDELAPDATGWLGSTFGFTDDGQVIGVVRFTDRAAAAANSDRPEQAAWWAEFEGCLSGPATFHDTEDVTVMLDGGSDDAGFVQVIQGKVTDAGELRSVMEMNDDVRRLRPDIIGATLAIDDDGTFTETVAFTSEAAARTGENGEMPPEIASLWDEAASEVSFYDLRSPWFSSTH
jgi:hypothetical protein